MLEKRQFMRGRKATRPRSWLEHCNAYGGGCTLSVGLAGKSKGKSGLLHPTAMESAQSRPAWNITDLASPLSAGVLACLVAIVCYQADGLAYVFGIPPDHIASFLARYGVLSSRVVIGTKKNLASTHRRRIGGDGLLISSTACRLASRFGSPLAI